MVELASRGGVVTSLGALAWQTCDVLALLVAWARAQVH